MNRYLSLLILTLLSVAPLSGQKLTILHTNDMHSRLWGFGPETEYTPLTINDDQTIGGFARIATILAEYRHRQPESLLVVDAGDFLMGTIFHTMEAQTGFQLQLMKTMGYDLVAIGNHEFDMGPRHLAKIISRSAQGPIPGLLLSNIRFDPDDPEDDALEALFSNGLILPYRIIERENLRIGVFSLMGIEAAHVAPYAAPATFTDRIEKARTLTQLLRQQENADLVICLSHSGLAFDPKKGWAGEDVELATQVPGIDVIVSGHSHTRLAKPIQVKNTIIVQAGSEGRFVGKLVIEKTPAGVVLLSDELIPVNDQIPGDPMIQRMIADQQEKIGAELFSGYGFSAGKPVMETKFDLAFNEQTNLETSNLGPFLADALYGYAKSIDPSPTHVALVTAGLTRDEILAGKTGVQLPSDLFRIFPLGQGVNDDLPGYSMSKVYVTGRELKNILEVMLIAPGISTGNYPYWSGIRFRYNSARLPLDRVFEVEIGNDEDGYEPIPLNKDGSRLYGVVTNAYVLEFFGLIKDLTKGILKVVPKHADGTVMEDLKMGLIDRDPSTPGIQEAKEWAALMTFASRLPDLDGNGIPDVPDKYRVAIPRSERVKSIRPSAYWKGTNGVNVVPAALVTLAAGGIALLVF
ncbi:MAG: 5'-nucleotidase C-terminal domain-containing protein [Bacteroidales bacterium]